MNGRRHISIHYCGGCNSRINRAEVAAELRDVLVADYEVSFNAGNADYVVYLCGCTASCVWKYGDRNIPCAVIAAENVDGLFVGKNKIVAEVMTKVRNYFGRLEKSLSE